MIAVVHYDDCVTCNYRLNLELSYDVQLAILIGGYSIRDDVL